MFEREDLTDHPAHRNSYEVDLCDAEAGEQPVQVISHLLVGVGTWRGAGLAMAPRVLPEHPVASAERPSLVIPHGEVASEGVAQRHHRAFPLDRVMDVYAVRCELHKASLFDALQQWHP